MTKWHTHVALMRKHMNMVGGPGLLAPPKSGAGQTIVPYSKHVI